VCGVGSARVEDEAGLAGDVQALVAQLAESPGRSGVDDSGEDPAGARDGLFGLGSMCAAHSSRHRRDDVHVDQYSRRSNRKSPSKLVEFREWGRSLQR